MKKTYSPMNNSFGALPTKDNWIKVFENTRLVKMGGMCFECCDYEDMVDDMKAFISQVEKDAIEKTNKRWKEKLKKEHWVIELPLSDLLEDK